MILEITVFTRKDDKDEDPLLAHAVSFPLPMPPSPAPGGGYWAWQGPLPCVRVDFPDGYSLALELIKTDSEQARALWRQDGENEEFVCDSCGKRIGSASEFMGHRAICKGAVGEITKPRAPPLRHGTKATKRPEPEIKAAVARAFRGKPGRPFALADGVVKEAAGWYAKGASLREIEARLEKRGIRVSHKGIQAGLIRLGVKLRPRAEAAGAAQLRPEVREKHREAALASSATKSSSAARNAVACPDCGVRVSPNGLGPHRRIHRKPADAVSVGKTADIHQVEPTKGGSPTVETVVKILNRHFNGEATPLIRRSLPKEIEGLAHVWIARTYGRMGVAMPKGEPLPEAKRMWLEEMGPIDRERVAERVLNPPLRDAENKGEKSIGE